MDERWVYSRDTGSPESGYEYRDTGCTFHPSCLTCPFPQCVEEYGRGKERDGYVIQLVELGFDVGERRPAIFKGLKEFATCKRTNDELVPCAQVYARGLCMKHYRRQQRRGLANGQVRREKAA